MPYLGQMTWISQEDTHVLLRYDLPGEINEWTVVGQVMLRRIYEAVPPQWFGWLFEEPRNQLVCREDTLEEAKSKVAIVVAHY